jgi:carboxylesterase type B
MRSSADESTRRHGGGCVSSSRTPKGIGRPNVSVDLPDSPAASEDCLYLNVWYFFTHEPPYAPDSRNLKATHTVEIPYVFNNHRPPRVFPDASSPELASASASERALAERVSSYWVNFARAGDPNGKGRPRWRAFSDASAAPMIIGEIKETPDSRRLAIYDKLYAKILASLKE